MLLDQSFPHQVCINLDRRTDRWRQMQAKFARQELALVHRFAARDGSTLVLPATWRHTAGAYGCLLSHVAVVEKARELGHESVLIFEDDAVFDPEFKLKFASFIAEVPSDWDMLYFGALHKDEPARITDHVYRVTKANSTYSYALKRSVFDAFIELNARSEQVLDVNAYELQQRFNCYCFLPHLAWVESEYSDVQNRLERHWYLEKSLVLFGSHVDRVLSETAIVVLHRGAPNQNSRFLERYYSEYFGDFARVELANSCPTRIEDRFLILTASDLYLETLDIRANLLMCEQYDGATGYSHVIDLTPEQAQLLRETGITRGIDVSKSRPVTNVQSQCRFITRDALNAPPGTRELRLFASPNHALRLPLS